MLVLHALVVVAKTTAQPPARMIASRCVLVLEVGHGVLMSALCNLKLAKRCLNYLCILSLFAIGATDQTWFYGLRFKWVSKNRMASCLERNAILASENIRTCPPLPLKADGSNTVLEPPLGTSQPCVASG